MGNCGGCTRTTGPQMAAPTPTKQDRIQMFEQQLPFQMLYIDEFESLVMAVARVSKKNEQYYPPLHKNPC